MTPQQAAVLARLEARYRAHLEALDALLREAADAAGQVSRQQIADWLTEAVPDAPVSKTKVERWQTKLQAPGGPGEVRPVG
ncbi:hypothetical protein [Streptomyces sp. URMC 129]|uniref:hypothetical protein n=1 Tax=Streptomyces sp. URMC 129 TaxID=3423407 RepID=UPI003F1C2046